MKLAIKWRDVAVLLLPVFFLLHEWNARFVLLDYLRAFPLLLYYSLATTGIYLLCLLAFKNRSIAFFMCNIIGFAFFFYGKFLNALSIEALKYALLVLFGIIVGIWIIYKQVSSSEKLVFKLNSFYILLLSIYLVIEIGTLGMKISGDKPQKTTHVKTSIKPDIYLLVLDEYTSSKALLKYYGYNNYKFDSFLLRNDFINLPESKSNYNFTFFSIAGLLNSKYLTGINTQAINYVDFLKAFDRIRNSSNQDFLESNGYDVRNYSGFNLRDHHTKYGLDISAFDEEGIFQQTLPGRLMHLFQQRFGKKEWQQSDYVKQYEERFSNLSLAEQETKRTSSKPRFVYMHILAPHVPFYTDSLGNLKTSEADYKRSVAKDPAAYTSYLSYCNTKIEKLISAILTATQNKAVIIVMGDHGLRKTDITSIDNEHHFMNMMAIHLPNGQQPSGQLPNSPVNIFPFVFNNVFNTQLPFLPDSSVFLRLSTHLKPI